MGLFTAEDEAVRAGTLYLRIAGPAYALYGLGMAIYFAMQGVGNVVPAVLANALRLVLSAGGALAAASWLDAGPVGIFTAIACGFVSYGAVNAYLLSKR
jgi:Na+-driven multidrug efflux pump